MNRNIDSFEDRIDDDLFELIISYLPIKDKLRYESVFKRFQRLIFNKQNVLVISFDNKPIDNLSDLLFKHGQINISKLERLLNKFRFINVIEFNLFYSNRSEVLNTITFYECSKDRTSKHNLIFRDNFSSKKN